jgi:predicted flap endonuclease-1-like 5' DNA nuclease
MKLTNQATREEEMTKGREDRRTNGSGGAIGLLVGFLLGLLIAWIYGGGREDEEEEEMSRSTEEMERVTLEPGPLTLQGRPPAKVEADPDDLTRVEGIGPRIWSLLRDLGIVSFEELANANPEELERLLHQEGLQFADPRTWPEQAALAAAGDWKELRALQQELSAGRRMG